MEDSYILFILISEELVFTYDDPIQNILVGRFIWLVDKGTRLRFMAPRETILNTAPVALPTEFTSLGRLLQANNVCRPLLTSCECRHVGELAYRSVYRCILDRFTHGSLQTFLCQPFRQCYQGLISVRFQQSKIRIRCVAVSVDR
jgi:hypothetical protein